MALKQKCTFQGPKSVFILWNSFFRYSVDFMMMTLRMVFHILNSPEVFYFSTNLIILVWPILILSRETQIWMTLNEIIIEFDLNLDKQIFFFNYFFFGGSGQRIEGTIVDRLLLKICY